jgi:hypothetical protein
VLVWLQHLCHTRAYTLNMSIAAITQLLMLWKITTRCMWIWVLHHKLLRASTLYKGLSDMYCS